MGIAAGGARARLGAATFWLWLLPACSDPVSLGEDPRIDDDSGDDGDDDDDGDDTFDDDAGGDDDGEGCTVGWSVGTVADSVEQPTHVTLTSLGGSVALTWVQGGTLHFASLAGDGTLLADPAALDSGPGQVMGFGAARTGSDLAVSYSLLPFDGSGLEDLWFLRAGASGTVGDDFPVRTTGSTQRSAWPRTVAADGELGAAWIEENLGPKRVIFSRITARGRLSGDPWQLDSTNADPTGRPSIAWNGEDFAAAWTWGSFSTSSTAWDTGVRFMRISGAGELLDEAPVDISNTEMAVSDPVLVWAGDAYTVVWADERGAAPELYLRRIFADGTPVADAHVVHPSEIQSALPSLLWTLGEHVLAWRAGAPGDTVRLMFARLDPEGATQEVQVVATSPAPHDVDGPAIAAGEAGYLMAWSQRQSPGGGYALRIGHRCAR